jgi:hypothetical protein
MILLEHETGDHVAARDPAVVSYELEYNISIMDSILIIELRLPRMTN